jgi:hypothetical protein
MNDLFEEDWSDSMAGINERALETNAKDTNQVMQSLFNSSKQARDRRLSSIIQQGAKSILDCATINKLELEEASNAFLKLATNIETLLSDLLLEKRGPNDFAEQEELLLSGMGNMTLAADLIE